jgi:hypothetical protein
VDKSPQKASIIVPYDMKITGLHTFMVVVATNGFKVAKNSSKKPSSDNFKVK